MRRLVCCRTHQLYLVYLFIFLFVPTRGAAQQYPAMWADNGVPVCTQPDSQGTIEVSPDGAGGAWVAWEDWRNTERDMFVQRLYAWGSTAFALVEGLPVCTAVDSQVSPQVVNDGPWGAFIAWTDYRGVRQTYAQYVAHSNQLKFADDGIPITTTLIDGGQRFPSLVHGEPGAVIVFNWLHARPYGCRCNVACQWYQNAQTQKLNDSGELLWGEAGSFFTRHGCELDDVENNVELVPVAVANDSGGAIAVWKYFGGNEGHDQNTSDVYARFISSMGGGVPVNPPTLPDRGLPVCTAPGFQVNPRIATNGNGGAIICWEDNRTSATAIYAQWISASGDSVGWSANGVLVGSSSGSLLNPEILDDGAGGAWVVWEDHSDLTDVDLYLQHLTSTGDTTGTRIALCTAAGNQGKPVLVSDDSGGLYVAWWDERSGERDIYAQRIDASGTALWTADGLAVCTAALDQDEPRVVSDGIGGMIVVWRDGRNGNSDIYAQRFWGKDPTDALPRDVYPHITVAPNPSPGTTTVSLALPVSGRVEITVYNVAGRQVRALTDKRFHAGPHLLSWDGKDDRQRPVPPGIYFVRARGSFGAVDRKVAVLR